MIIRIKTQREGTTENASYIRTHPVLDAVACLAKDHYQAVVCIICCEITHTCTRASYSIVVITQNKQAVQQTEPSRPPAPQEHLINARTKVSTYCFPHCNDVKYMKGTTLLRLRHGESPWPVKSIKCTSLPLGTVHNKTV